jgi:transcriptional regulator with XRE-family HTH domain
MTANSLPTNGTAIRALRKARGLKIRELAEGAKVSGAYISAIETNRVDGSSWVLARIAAHLNVPLQQIVSEQLPDAVAA